VTIFNPPSTSSTIPVNGTLGPSHNTDGVDVHGTPFAIHGCHFDTGDDNVAVHASNVIVHDCFFGHGHGASIGSLGGDAAIENVTFARIKFENTDAAAKIKTRPGATGYCRNVLFQDLSLKNVRESMSISMFYDSSKPDPDTKLQISDITISGLTSKGTKTDVGKDVTPGSFDCQPSAPCRNIVLKDISHETKLPFECSNAYGSADNVKPKSCLKKK
jgi:polygalacturonase